MSKSLGRLSMLLVAATATAVVLVGLASGFVAAGAIDRSETAVIAGLFLLVMSLLITVLYEPVEI